MKEKFKVGDLVKFDGVGPYAALKGATARVVKINEENEWLNVEWIDYKANGQMDGNYKISQFEALNKPVENKPVETSELKNEKLFQLLEKWSGLLDEFYDEVGMIKDITEADKLIWNSVREIIALNKG